MEYAKSVRSAFQTRTLFASACPVLLAVSLLYNSHGVSLLAVDTLSALGCAMLTHLLGNLSAVYSNFHRQLEPKQQPNAKIVLNLLSLTQVRRWSFLLYTLQLALLVFAHVMCNKIVATTGGMVLLVTLALAYCRSGEGALPIAGMQEAIVAWGAGPVAMLATSLYLVGEAPWLVVFYAHLVMLYVWAFLLLQSAQDAPFARRMGRSDTSLALQLGFQRTFQGFVLLLASCYGLLIIVGLAMGHLGNLLLLLTFPQVKDMSDDFRHEKLHDLPTRLGRLGFVLGVGLVLSVVASGLMA